MTETSITASLLSSANSDISIHYILEGWSFKITQKSRLCLMNRTFYILLIFEYIYKKGIF